MQRLRSWLLVDVRSVAIGTNTKRSDLESALLLLEYSSRELNAAISLVRRDPLCPERLCSSV